jgi:hypothetical protein
MSPEASDCARSNGASTPVSTNNDRIPTVRSVTMTFSSEASQPEDVDYGSLQVGKQDFSLLNECLSPT